MIPPRATTTSSGWPARPIPGALPAIRFDCGTEDGLLEENRVFHAHLEMLGIEHEYKALLHNPILASAGCEGRWLRRPASTILAPVSPALPSLPSALSRGLGPTERVLQQRLRNFPAGTTGHTGTTASRRRYVSMRGLCKSNSTQMSASAARSLSMKITCAFLCRGHWRRTLRGCSTRSSKQATIRDRPGSSGTGLFSEFSLQLRDLSRVKPEFPSAAVSADAEVPGTEPRAMSGASISRRRRGRIGRTPAAGGGSAGREQPGAFHRSPSAHPPA